MDWLSPILDIGTCLWNCSSKHLAYLHSLEENLQKLRAEKDALERRRHDVWRRVEDAERQPRMRRSEEVEGWLKRAEAKDNEVNEIIQKGDQEVLKKCVGSCCPRNIKSTYSIGKRVVKRINSVSKLLDEGEHYCSDSAVAVRLPPNRLLLPDRWPMENILGLESPVERVWRCIEDERVRVIRLCGLGGVGKTTLLKKVSNEFHRRSHEFDAVIWAKVPTHEGYIEKVQEVIRKKLEISDAIWDPCSGEDEKGAQIYRVLNGKKFVLLLDNVWERFDLVKLGIQLRSDQNQSKVIFTARSLSVELYSDKRSQETIEVKRLPPEQALSLFRMTVDESILSSDPEFSEMAITFAKRCGGLPLALLTVARAVASRENLHDWRHTVNLLHTFPSEIADMGARVFPLLKFSYEILNEATQNCFLYCSIFPEDYDIRIDELIDLWMGEGFLNGPNPCDHGEFIVGTLKLANLLESDESKQCVRMHDVIRHLALWLARDEGRNNNKVLVAKTGRITDQDLTKWEGANWVSFFGSSSRANIEYSPSCRYLSTLLLRDAQLESFPSGFFESTPALKVLDLSGNGGLVELPSNIGNVKTLQYLNLSFTSIAELPAGIRNLRNLRCLLLDYTVNLKWIPQEMISNLLLLQVYSKINGVAEYFGSMEALPYDEVAFLRVLECFNHISKIGITIFTAPSLEKIMKSYTLLKCIRKLTFMECVGLNSLCFTEELSNIESLEIFRCGSLKEFKISKRCKLGNLQKVCIGLCPLLLNLNVLASTRKLEILSIFDCESMEEVTSEKMAFPGLKTISLTHLQKLKSICPSPGCLPSLLEIEVSKCPWLRQLPFDLESANFLQKIRGETEWWDGLIWDDEAVKDACHLKLVSTPLEPLTAEDNSFTFQMGSFEGGDPLINNDGFQILSLSGPETPLPVKQPETDEYENLRLEDMETIKLIGKGSSGIVALVRDKWTGKFFALKTTHMGIEESARRQIAMELKINQSSDSPYIVANYQSFYNNGTISMVFEYMDGGSLADFLKIVKTIPEYYLAAICKQVLNGLMYIHFEKHIIHRDIKPSNLLINHRGEVKIADFGVSATLTSTSDRANTFVGTYNYMSPERMTGDSYDIKVDIWSLGLVLLECATGRFPYSPAEPEDGWTNIYELMEAIVEQPPPCAPSDQFSPEFSSFISACLQKDPKDRKPADELMALPFLNMYDDFDVDLSSYFCNAESPLATL